MTQIPVVAGATTLSDLPVSRPARITGYADGCPPQVAQRLGSLGFTDGTPVTKVRRAPMGDPAVYRLMNYEICLRRREADYIRCAPLADHDDAGPTVSGVAS